MSLISGFICARNAMHSIVVDIVLFLMSIRKHLFSPSFPELGHFKIEMQILSLGLIVVVLK